MIDTQIKLKNFWIPQEFLQTYNKFRDPKIIITVLRRLQNEEFPLHRRHNGTIDANLQTHWCQFANKSISGLVRSHRIFHFVPLSRFAVFFRIKPIVDDAGKSRKIRIRWKAGSRAALDSFDLEKLSLIKSRNAIYAIDLCSRNSSSEVVNLSISFIAGIKSSAIKATIIYGLRDSPTNSSQLHVAC